MSYNYYCPTCGGRIDPLEHDDIKRWYWCHGCSDLKESVLVSPNNQTILTICNFGK